MVALVAAAEAGAEYVPAKIAHGACSIAQATLELTVVFSADAEDTCRCVCECSEIYYVAGI